MMNIILLSGGSGKRLWPLSNGIRSKQFIKIFKDGQGGYESMVQRVYRQIRKVDPSASITVATSKSQVSTLLNQLGENIGISVEPCRRDTFPAIVLSAAYLHDVQDIPLGEAVVVCPVDPYVDDDYFEALRAMSRQTVDREENLVLMGIEPSYPSEKYGYILPDSADVMAKVKSFKEKPDAKTAEEYIAKGALWNGGVFACRLGYLLEKAHGLIDFDDYYDLYSKYEKLEAVSFDYAVVERESSILVQRFSGQWKDIGTWNTLAEAMEDSVLGCVMVDGKCENVHAINELDIPILCMGLKDVVLSASPDGILISDKDRSSYIKPFVDQINTPVMYAEKSWGNYRVIDVSADSLTVKVMLQAGSRMNYHSHEHRNEIWSIISGTGRAVVDGMEQIVKPGDVVTMQAGCRHTVIAETDLEMIEVQLGHDISVKDKKKYELKI